MSDNVTRIWDLYESGKTHHTQIGMYKEAELCHDFYKGEHWKGLESGGEKFPILNYIKPVTKYKVAMIAMNNMAIVYSSMDNDENTKSICKALTDFAAKQWEKCKMDSQIWKVLKNACITGDHYMYFFDERKPTDSVVQDIKPQIKSRLINRTNIYLSDEQCPELNEQEWIIISERVPVSRVREIAKKNGVSEIDIEMITKDEETKEHIGEDSGREVKSELGKCTSLLFMQKTSKGIEFCRSVRQVIYEPIKTIEGLDTYPIASFRWEEDIGSARGLSGVKYLIPNQLEVNKTLARRALAVKRFSYPKLAYDGNAIKDIGATETIGASIEIENPNGLAINQLIQYLNPAPISSDASNLQNEMLQVTRELEGAGDAATGQVDPTKTSGEAIKAARDQSAIPLNEQIALYKQFIEDIAVIWYKLWTVYSIGGLGISMDNEPIIIPQEYLKKIDIDIRIDVTPVDPFSRLSQEMALERALTQQYISFEEYVEALDDSSGVPKGKLQKILQQREASESEMQGMSNGNASEQLGAVGGQGNISLQMSQPQMY